MALDYYALSDFTLGRSAIFFDWRCLLGIRFREILSSVAFRPHLTMDLALSR